MDFKDLIDANGHAEIPEGTLIIPQKAFYNPSTGLNKLLKSVSIPDSVTEIQSRAFYGCSALLSVTIPDSVKRIGSFCFANCSSLNSVTLPKNLKKIEKGVFGPSYFNDSFRPEFERYGLGGCKDLKEIVLPESISVIEEAAFWGSGLQRIAIPQNVKEISRWAFYNCQSLVSFKATEGVKVIQDGCFSDCISLTSIDLPKTLTEIGSSAFHNCQSLVSVKVPEKVEVIKSDCFSGCKSLSFVDLPKSLTGISIGAFENCSSLVSITIPEGVNSFEGGYRCGCFKGCSSLETVNLPAEMDSIGQNTFQGCCKLKSIVIPKGVSTIGDKVFTGCDDVHLHISETVVKFDPRQNDAREITVSSDNEVLSVENDCLVDKQKRELLFIPDKATSFPKGLKSIRVSKDRLPSLLDVEELTIPDGVTHVECLPFAMMKKLKKLNMPLSLKSCGNDFMEGYQLPDITVTPDLMLSTGFHGWRGISTVNLKGVDSIDASILERIKEKYKQDKSVSRWENGKTVHVDMSLCVYLNGQNVYPAAHIVRKKEEAILLKPEREAKAELNRKEKEAKAELERKKKELSETLEDITLASLCSARFDALGIKQTYDAEDNKIKVTIHDEFIIGYKLSLAGSQDDLAFIVDVADTFHNALKAVIDRGIPLSVILYYYGLSYGLCIGCPIDGYTYLVFGLEKETMFTGLEAMKAFSDALDMLSEKYGEKMKDIVFYR